MQYKSLPELNDYLSSFVYHYKTYANPQMQLNRMHALMAELGNPQDKIKIIHIAGTSGKGSTAQYLSSMVSSQGFKTGVTVSPHLKDIRERAQISNTLLPQRLFCQYVSQIVPAIESVSKSTWGKPSFFEITMALAFYIFLHEKVDYAIIETGLGGRFDASNVVRSRDKICVITPIGMDHMEYLGDTIDTIAFEKAGIIQNGNHVITIVQDPQAAKRINQAAKIQNASLQLIDTALRSHIVSDHIEFEWKDATTTPHKIQLRSPAQYQVQNVVLGLSVIEYLAQRDQWPIEFTSIVSSLKSTRIPGRFDLLKINNKNVVFDGAHNPQKMSAFLSSLKSAYPSQTFEFLVGFSAAKDYGEMLRMIIPHASRITLTQFGEGNQGMKLSAASCSELSSILRELGYPDYGAIPDAKVAFDQSLARTSDMLIVTGSLYLLSDLYRKLDL